MVEVLKHALILGVTFFCGTAIAEERPIFDAHIHYSHDAVKQVPPEQVAKILRDAGVRKALVSSSDDNGTQLLLDAAPDIVVPALRPYRRRGEINTWMHDETVIGYLEENLAKNKYKAIGEFHAYGDDIKTPVIQHMIALAKERNLILHHHGDREAVDLIFEAWPKARVLWAHSGFDDPASVTDALDTYPRLWADLAFRSDMVSRGRVDPDWKAAFEAHPDRFMVGTDTFAPERWYYVGPHADFSREWLAFLPDQIADNIAYANAERLLAPE
ncbi:amidohydrolase [Ruegeria sp. A3M17]|nr:amidohydrolase [Ruegeria sp. A3M17]